MLGTMTAEMRAKATATRQARAARLRRDFADAPEWERLASQYGVRQPAWNEAVTTGTITRWCKRLGISLADYREWTGGSTLRYFAEVESGLALARARGAAARGAGAGPAGPPRPTARRGPRCYDGRG